MLYKRQIHDQIKKHLPDKEIIVITGMRQVGKTTLCQMLLDEIKSDNKAFLDMENPITQKVFEEQDYNNIIANLQEFNINTRSRAYVALDEIQAMPEATKAIKYLYDHYQIKFILTGSSSYYLKNLFPESLAGRKFVFELSPLNFNEWLVFKNINHDVPDSLSQKVKIKNEIRFEKTKKNFDKYLEFGGFPAVVLAEDSETKKLRLNDIFKSYFEKDVKLLADFREINAFRDLILLLMQRIGSKLDISKLSSEVGVSRETVYSFLSFLESTYFIRFIRPLTRNVDREVSGARKVYLCDTGLLNNFAKISAGSLLENAVFLNLRNYQQVSYYQKRSGAEIDFIINKKIALEVKTKGAAQDYNMLKRTARSLGLKESYLVTKEFNSHPHAILATDL